MLKVDGKVVNEPYLDPEVVTPDVVRLAVRRHRGPDRPRVRDGRQPGGSEDSRDGQVGQIAYGHLVGRAFVVIWPFGDWQWL